jgi:uncharacterized peroxidase-related enzyme
MSHIDTYFIYAEHSVGIQKLILLCLHLYRSVGIYTVAAQFRRSNVPREQGEMTMSRLQPVDPATATGKAKDLLDAVKAKLGIVPNMTRVMASSPVVLESYLAFSGALADGLLDAKTREALALLTAQENHCDYCLSAHTAIGKMVGLNEEQIIASRAGNGLSPKATAALAFAKRVLDTKGEITEADLAAAKAAGISEGETAEIIAHVALNVFTNYFNVATDVDIDFPKVSYSKLA